MATNTLPRWCERLLAEVDECDARARAVAGDLSVTQLNWRPQPGAWGVGHCLEHLRASNEVYVGAIAAALTNRQPQAVDDITPGWFGRWFIRTAIEPSPSSRKGRAPRIVRPGEDVGADILPRFLKSQDIVRAALRQAAPYDVNRIRFKNPYVTGIRFTVGTGFEIVLRHERRHLLQAERAREAAGSDWGQTSNSRGLTPV